MTIVHGRGSGGGGGGMLSLLSCGTAAADDYFKKNRLEPLCAKVVFLVMDKDMDRSN